MYCVINYFCAYRIDCGKNMIFCFCYNITLFRNNHDKNLLGINCIEKVLYFPLNIMTWNSCTMFVACIVHIAFSMSYICAIACSMPLAFTMSTAFTIAYRLQHAHRLLKNVDRLQHAHHLCYAIACVILIAACTMPLPSWCPLPAPIHRLHHDQHMSHAHQLHHAHRLTSVYFKVH